MAAEPTDAAYFANTPWRNAARAATIPAARRASSSSGTSTSSSPLLDVDDDGVAVADDGERAAVERLGRDVPDHQPVGGAGEAAVGDQRHLVAEPLADERRGDVQHLAHPRPAGGAFVADHDDVARLDRPRLDGGEAVLLGVEHARRAAVMQPLVARELDDAAVGREVAAQDREAARRLERVVPRDDDVLPGALVGAVGDLAERAAVDRDQHPRATRPAAHQLAGDERDAAGLEEVGRDVAAARLDVGDDRRARRDRVEVVDRELDPGLGGDRQQVQDAVRRASGRGDRGDRVLEGVAREHLTKDACPRRTSFIASSPARDRRLRLARVRSPGSRSGPAR